MTQEGVAQPIGTENGTNRRHHSKSEQPFPAIGAGFTHVQCAEPRLAAIFMGARLPRSDLIPP